MAVNMDKSFSETLLVRFAKGGIIHKIAERQVDMELQAKLIQAITVEDFEAAAEIRDKLTSQRKGIA
jgi:protein-arginine kinase activator protein McsA